MKRNVFLGKWGSRGKKSIVMCRQLRRMRGGVNKTRGAEPLEGGAIFVDCLRPAVVNSFIDGYPVGVNLIRSPNGVILGNHVSNASRAAYMFRQSPSFTATRNIAVRGEKMADDNSVGFDFGDADNSKITNNEAHGFPTGMRADSARGAEIAGNKVYREQGPIIQGKIAYALSILSATNTNNDEITKLRLALEGIRDQLVKDNPEPSLLTHFAQYIGYGITDVTTGALGNILSENASKLTDALESIQAFLNSIL